MTRQQPRPSPYAWLWAELERRFGAEAAAEIKAGYLAQNRVYGQVRWHTPESPWQPRAKPPSRARRELAYFEEQLAERKAQGRATARIERTIAHWRAKLDGEIK
jgi:hypothetical protein